ncbi:MAG: 3-oxoacyl-[acyl-carrier-protein] reductase FabG [Phycisphaerae bacterium]|nr:3-oxoacyl-[acyl-carrier-protein] reductase FabG [Phycisphaerae bacterium]
MQTDSMKGKVAIVTGAARGIGREIVRELVSGGATVVAVDLLADAMADLAQAVGAADGQVDCRTLDVTNSEGFTALVEDVAARYEHIDVLVNNAGITRDGLLIRMEDADWEKVIKVNLTSAFIGTRAVGKYMVRQRSGSIVNMASYSGIEGNRGQANYAASKAGLIGLTKTTAKELAGKKVRCNAVAPGFIKTDMTDALPQQAKDIALSLIPLKEMGLPQDIAKAVAFLASDDSSYITGQVLSVDGGMHM